MTSLPTFRLSHCAVHIVTILSLFELSACKKFVDVPPPYTKLTEGNVYSDDAKAISTVTDIYGAMNGLYFQGVGSIGMVTGLSSDELDLHGGVTDPKFKAYYTNRLVSSSTVEYGAEFWAGVSGLYNYIYKCNAAIKGLQSSQTLTSQVKQQLLGEVKFLRAFYLFYLTNLYGEIPVTLTTDYEINRTLKRSSKSEVYQQIITDLKEAKGLLTEIYVDGTLMNTSIERIRPTKWAAIALLARAYLYNEEWANAETEASNLINSPLFSLAQMSEVFKKNSQEAIWQLQPTALYFNTTEARAYILPTTGPSNNTTNPVYLSKEILNVFEPGDLRRKEGNWINSRTVSGKTYYFPFKYKLGTRNMVITTSSQMEEYFMVLRLAEQYLIRAEARIMQGKNSESVSDINKIRERARDSATVDLPEPLPDLSQSLSKEEILSAILHERRVELFVEWGHRWFDLKRTKKIDAVMNLVTPKKSGGLTTWQNYQQLYPIPINDIKRSSNLFQNQGY